MPIGRPNCFYRKLFVEKRKGARLVYDFSLTIGFSSNTRWVDPKNSDEFLEFGLKRADLDLELVNGNIDLKEGDKLGGELQLDTQKKISSMKKAEDKKTRTNIGATASLTPSLKIDLGGDERQKESEYRTELQAIHLTVHGNLSDSERPFWTFIPVEGHLNGKLTMAPLCAVKAKEKCNFTYSHRIVVHLNDINITCMPKKWTDKLPLPFKGLRTQKVKQSIINVISDSEKILENAE